MIIDLFSYQNLIGSKTEGEGEEYLSKGEDGRQDGKLEEEIRRKQKKCEDQKGKEKNTCLKEKMGDHASSGD